MAVSFKGKKQYWPINHGEFPELTRSPCSYSFLSKNHVLNLDLITSFPAF